MVKHHELSSQKYVDAVQKVEIRQIKRQMFFQSGKSMLLFLFSIVVFLLAMYAVFQMPNWMPAINVWLEQVGILTSNAA